MPRFIKVTRTGSDKLVNINLDHIISYSESPSGHIRIVLVAPQEPITIFESEEDLQFLITEAKEI